MTARIGAGSAASATWPEHAEPQRRELEDEDLATQWRAWAFAAGRLGDDALAATLHGRAGSTPLPLAYSRLVGGDFDGAAAALDAIPVDDEHRATPVLRAAVALVRSAQPGDSPPASPAGGGVSEALDTLVEAAFGDMASAETTRLLGVVADLCGEQRLADSAWWRAVTHHGSQDLTALTRFAIAVIGKRDAAAPPTALHAAVLDAAQAIAGAGRSRERRRATALVVVDTLLERGDTVGARLFLAAYLSRVEPDEELHRRLATLEPWKRTAIAGTALASAAVLAIGLTYPPVMMGGILIAQAFTYPGLTREQTAVRRTFHPRRPVGPGAPAPRIDRCWCWRSSALADEDAVGYLSGHLVHGAGCSGTAEASVRRISPSAVLMRCPLSGTPWLTGPIASDGATMTLRGLPLEPSPSPADDSRLLTGFYL